MNDTKPLFTCRYRLDLKQVDTQMKTIWPNSKGSDRKTLVQAIEVEKSGILRQKKNELMLKFLSLNMQVK